LRELTDGNLALLFELNPRQCKYEPGRASDQASEEQKASFEQRGQAEFGSRFAFDGSRTHGQATRLHWQQWRRQHNWKASQADRFRASR